MTIKLMIAVFISCLVRPALADPVYMLTQSCQFSRRNQTDCEGQMFFFTNAPRILDNDHDKVIFTHTADSDGNAVRQSNVLVWEYKGEIKAVDGLQAWVDPRGHAHTLATLKKQVDFDAWLGTQEDCRSGCDLKADRDSAYRVDPVAVTGIMDRRTLEMPRARLEMSYELLYNFLQYSCAAEPGCSVEEISSTRLSALAEALKTARKALDEYGAMIRTAPLSRPERPVSTDPWPSPPRANRFSRSIGGLPLTCPHADHSHCLSFPLADAERLDKMGEEYIFLTAAPEKNVEESVDSAMPAGISEDIQQKEMAAGDAMTAAKAEASNVRDRTAAMDTAGAASLRDFAAGIAAELDGARR